MAVLLLCHLVSFSHLARGFADGTQSPSLNARNVSENTSAWENILRRLRARRDPPRDSPRPDEKTYRSVISRLEQALDNAYSPKSGLNLAEYATDTEWATRIAALICGCIYSFYHISDPYTSLKGESVRIPCK